MSIEAMKQAQALRELADRFSEGWHDGIKIDASDIMLLTEVADAIEQAEKQEPVAWRTKRNGAWSYHANEPHGVPNEPLYTTPPAAPVQEPDRTGMTYYKNDTCKAAIAYAPDCICWTPAAQRQWVGLTDEQIKQAKPVCADFVSFRAGVRYAEAMLREKNGGQA